MQVQGYIVRSTDAAVAFIADKDMIDGVKPLWLPRKKIVSFQELDTRSKNIVTAQDGERVGTPVLVDIDDAFAAKVGVA
jgi:hypothetical protein